MASSCLTDTGTVNFTIEDDGTASAEVVVSTDAENLLEARSNGLFVGATSIAIPTGMCIPFAGPEGSIPAGWLFCDGREVSRLTYAALFAVIGILHGPGDGSSTFNLPDTIGRMVAGYGGSAGHVDVSVVGSNDGVADQSKRRPRHRHTVNDPGHFHSLSPPVVTNTAGGSTSLGPSPGVQILSSVQTNVTGITVGLDPVNDPLNSPGYIVMPMVIRT